MNDLAIEYLQTETLHPYANNARKHTDDDIEAIVHSIEQFGFDDPIGVWGKDNLVVEGHGRLEAAKKLGMKKVPCIRLDHLTEEQRRAYALAHNKTAELSGWDFAALEKELDDLAAEFEMSDFGFIDYSVKPESLDSLFAPAPEAEEPEEPKQIKCPHCGEWFTP